MPEGRQPRGVTPRPRSGAAAESTRLQRRRNRREELPCVRGQGGRPRGDTQHPGSGAVMRGVTPRRRSGAAGGRSYPTPPRPHALGQGLPQGGAIHARGQGSGCGREDQPHI